MPSDPIRFARVPVGSAESRAPLSAPRAPLRRSWSSPGQSWVLMRKPFLPKRVPRAILERFWVLPGSLRTSKSTFSLQRGSKFLKIALLLFETLSGRSVELQSPPRSSQEHPFGAPGCPKSPPKLSQGLPRASLETFKISKISLSEQTCF